MQGSGEALVRGITSDYAQVSYFGVANGAFLTGVAAIQQLSLALVAVLVTLRQEGKSALVDDAVRRLVSWLTTGGMTVVFAVLLLGPDLVPPVLGAFYTPVATNLIPMAVVLLIVSLSSPGNVALLTHYRPDVALVGAAVRLAAFWTFGPLLIARWGSLGACLAVLIASTLHTGYLGWRVRAAMPQALRAWITAVGLGTLFLPLLLVRCALPDVPRGLWRSADARPYHHAG